MFEKELVYQKESAVNWCPKCKTVLANEQVHNGKCEYHKDTDVEIKQLKQWFLKITNYADELYEDIDKLIGWAEDVKAMQRNWIGKSYGTEIIFSINGKKWPIFTTRSDTICGVTFMVISAQHPRLMELVIKEQKKDVETFLKKIKTVSQKSIKNLEELDKEGVFTGSYAINPLTNDKIPVYAGNFVVADYGSGMVMAVPSHDQRDFEFAKKYKIPVKVVIQPPEKKIDAKTMKEPYTGYGTLINSGAFNGLRSEEAKEHIVIALQSKKLGRKTIQFRLKDWLVSRQRYWGTPIPIIHCDKCGIVPVPEKDLPVVLPENVKFGKGNPLETATNWINVKCPKCRGKALRETDTMDTFVNSSWYFLRYCDPHNDKKIFDNNKVKYWMPIDIYMGGKEHACMHLIYFRFYTKFLRDLGLLNFDEPTLNQFNQGMIGYGGSKMSKSLGNIVNPIDVIDKFSADILRLFIVSVASPGSAFNWDDKGVEGTFKFINKIMNYFENVKIVKNANARTESKLNKTIKEVTYDIDNLKYNIAVIKLRELFNSLPEETSKDVLEKSLKLFSPFCPHIAEELWEKIGGKGFISVADWPKADEKKINEKFEKEDEAIESLKADINNIKKIMESRGEKKENVYVYVLPNELELYFGIEGIKIYAVNDKKKYDPEGKSKKAKPRKPAIYLE
jgi:leucyl-tRNA synthetase